MKSSRVGITAAALALLFTLTGCESKLSQSSTPQPVLASQSASVVGDGRLQPGEQCDDGNTVSGDGCSASGAIEAGYLCHVPGRACSLASLCGNNVANAGEACDDGDTVAGANGCSATCDLSLCGNGAFNNRQHPNFDQEICDDGNRFEGDGCSRQCEVEPGFACAGSPSRCVRAGVAVFNTGVDENNRRLETGADPHWFYAGTTTGAATGVRNAQDWPQEIQTARFMAPLGGETCVYQDFMVPSTTNVAQFRLRLATFNDNSFAGARVNGVTFTPVTISEPPGSPWQKNIIREFGTGAAWRPGLNRIELCNENAASPPNAFRYLFVDAYDDRCGDGVISLREECDDGDSTSGDGCSASCGIEAGYGCTGTPSTCAATCGNGLLNPGEQCDDGNTAANDGCNASCRVEPGNACPNPGQPCVLTCGNGAINDGEQCDDGNDNDSDGCSAACRIERGYECSGAPSTCNALCGNSRLDSGEQCDDGNSNLNDGCSIACTLELGYACPTPGQACVETCGNGTVNPGEQCDDGNLQSLDGCGTDCRVEPGYACSAPQTGPSVCAESCGNGTQEVNETCDDGDRQSGDGCSSGCRVETGYSCSGAPSTCATICGDGIMAGGERCDDGNTTASDGCAANCQVEPGWRCPAPGNVCFNTCGNGSVETGEECDDDDTTSGDGCANVCVAEPGYTCSGSPSVCRTTCGDGVVAGTEVCDDGNLSGGNCSPRCLWENGQPCMASGVCESGLCNPTSDVCVTIGSVPPPAAPVITGPTPGSVLSDSTPTLSGTAEPGSQVTVREGATVLCTATASDTGQWSCVPATPLADGAHSVTATATTAAGTSPVSAPDAFTIDTQAPDTSFVRNPPTLTEEGSAEFEYDSNEDGVRYECSLDGRDYVPCEDAYAVSTGEHTLRVRSVDAAGNVDASPAVYTWTVTDTRAFAGGGCSAAPATSWLALLGLLGLRRRNRRR